MCSCVTSKGNIDSASSNPKTELSLPYYSIVSTAFSAHVLENSVPGLSKPLVDASPVKSGPLHIGKKNDMRRISGTAMSSLLWDASFMARRNGSVHS